MVGAADAGADGDDGGASFAAVGAGAGAFFEQPDPMMTSVIRTIVAAVIMCHDLFIAVSPSSCLWYSTGFD
jgi:hypothetical protein